MPGDVSSNMTTGILVYDSERDCLLLEGQVLGNGVGIELRVFDAWIPGLIERDSSGWYLITHDQVGIRLHTGLPARMYEEAAAISANLLVLQETQPCILIVDDDPALLRALSHTIALRLRKARVNVANSAKDALALLQQQQYDAVVCDIKMPEMDGLELLARIHEHQPETPTLLITGHGEHELAIRALRGGAYDYIQKPIERDSFIAALLRAIQTCQLRRRVAEQQRTLETHARSLERVVQQRTHELIEAHAAKDKVISLVSHELVGPIKRLKEITQLLQQKLHAVEGTEVVLRSFADIEQSLASTEELVQELQETALIETRMFIQRCQRCNLVALCHTLLQEIAVAQAADLTWEATAESIEVEIDYDQIVQVLRTLLAHINMSSLPDTQTTITLQRASHEAIISVRNLGSQTHLGAGFYVSRKILEQHGGHLEIQSFLNGRRTIFISLPLLKSKDDSYGKEDASQPVTCATAIIRYPESHNTNEHDHETEQISSRNGA